MWTTRREMIIRGCSVLASPLTSVPPIKAEAVDAVQNSPFTLGEEAVIDAYLNTKNGLWRSLGEEYLQKLNGDPYPPLVEATLQEMRARYSWAFRTCLDVGAGIIIAKYASGASFPIMSQEDILKLSMVMNDRPFRPRVMDPHSCATRVLFSPVIFQIVWKDAKCIRPSWPEQYRATWIPSRREWIITGSIDSSVPYLKTDFAMGHLRHDTADWLGTVKELILDQWYEMKRQYGNPPWSAVDSGIVGADLAMAWRAEIWPE